MILWDLEAAAPDGALLWRIAAPGSVPARLEANSDRLRAKYLAFIRDLGERVSGPLTDDGFDFWWTTRLAEKSPFKSPGLYAALRLLALEEILLERRPESLELATGDAALAEAVETLCANLKIAFELHPDARPACRLGWPHPLHGFISFLRWALTRAPLTDAARAPWFGGTDAVFVCSFFFQLDGEAADRGEFRSNYWGPFPELLREAGRPVNWLHHYLSGWGYEVSKSAARVAGFNADSGRQGAHAFLESYLSLGVVLRAFERWLRLWGAVARTSGIEKAFVPEGSAVDLWPVLREDWEISLAGRVGALNCLWLELFDAALADVPRQKTGFYLWENQSWEPAFLRAWRKHGHGELTGVAHATVPYWHLYYFDAPGSRRPVPNRLAINGPAAARTFATAGAPAAPLVEVESLRYLPLAKIAAKRPAGKDIKALIVGDAIPESMASLLSSLEAARKDLPSGWTFAFKPHPLHVPDLAAYPGLKAEIVTEPLELIMDQYHVAIAGNSTSAAVDAREAGLPVVIEFNGRELNLSPLRGETGARFFSGAEELAAALTAAVPPARGDFFHLDAGLPRWRKLLQLKAP